MSRSWPTTLARIRGSARTIVAPEPTTPSTCWRAPSPGPALLAAVTLRQMRYAVADELAGLRASSEIGSGLVAMVFEEIRGAEQYLAAPSADARQLFQTASDETFHYERRLEALGITGEDRIAVDRKSTRLNSSHGYISYAVF